MKKILFLAGLLLTVATTSAQATLEKGALQLNAKLGFSGWGVPITVGADYGIADDITIGGELSYRSYKTTGITYVTEQVGIFRMEVPRSTDYRHSIFGILANGNYHFNRLFKLPSQVGVYAGLSLGYFIASSPSGYTGSSYSQFGYSVQTGARYFFNDKFGVNVEIAGGLVGGEFKAGVTYKL
ncbi:outer membrane beta-barrel protein [Capnocytophaga leadbetteri]